MPRKADFGEQGSYKRLDDGRYVITPDETPGCRGTLAGAVLLCFILIFIIRRIANQPTDIGAEIGFAFVIGIPLAAVLILKGF